MFHRSTGKPSSRRTDDIHMGEPYDVRIYPGGGIRMTLPMGAEIGRAGIADVVVEVTDAEARQARMRGWTGAEVIADAIRRALPARFTDIEVGDGGPGTARIA